jgi:hypothetical protein
MVRAIVHDLVFARALIFNKPYATQCQAFVDWMPVRYFAAFTWEFLLSIKGMECLDLDRFGALQFCCACWACR